MLGHGLNEGRSLVTFKYKDRSYSHMFRGGKTPDPFALGAMLYAPCFVLQHALCSMRHLGYALCALLIICQGCASTLLVDYRVGHETGKALVCRPEGDGPFPAVIYNHGLIVDRAGYQNASERGYDLDGFCHALAKDGFLAFVPIRGTGVRNIPVHVEEVSRAIDYVKTLPEVDPSRIALMGFSRGGLLTLMVGVERQDLKSLLILAPAPGRGHFAEAVELVPALNVPVLLLVEASDEDIILEDFALLKDALQANRKEARIIRYNQGGGHRLFWGVDYYWKDVGAFLRETLGNTASR